MLFAPSLWGKKHLVGYSIANKSANGSEQVHSRQVDNILSTLRLVLIPIHAVFVGIIQNPYFVKKFVTLLCYNSIMNLPTNYAKKIAKLRYKDEIIQLHNSGKSIRFITQKINYSLSRTKLSTKLSRESIRKIIKAQK
jgi:hypothetical protein